MTEDGYVFLFWLVVLCGFCGALPILLGLIDRGQL